MACHSFQASLQAAERCARLDLLLILMAAHAYGRHKAAIMNQLGQHLVAVAAAAAASAHCCRPGWACLLSHVQAVHHLPQRTAWEHTGAA